ncbi:MAG: GAF domain-containing protein [Devosia sp.]|nr:GAF domain-containing protein [Devosia sp.]
MDNPTQPDHVALAEAIADPAGQPLTSFEALRALAETLVGARMFTVLAFDFARYVMVRAYSTNEAIYPVNAADPITDSIWERTLIGERQPLVLNSPEAMATLLPNVPELVALGCEAMLNLPIVIAGKAIGAINLLDHSGRYTADRIAAAKALVPGAAAILLWQQLNGN